MSSKKKSVVIDEEVGRTLNALFSKESKIAGNSTGLLIGTIDKSTDWIVHTIGTPPNDELNTANSSVTTKKTNKEKENQKNAAEEIDLEWILNHAMQIHDMLVAGHDILGLYCVDLSASTGRQILVKLFKELNKFDYYRKMKFDTTRLLFLVDTSANSINTKAVDVSSTTITYKECDMKTQANLLRDSYVKCNSNYDLNSVFRTPNVKSYNLVKEDFYNALSVDALLDDYENKFVICLLNSGQLLDDSQKVENIKSSTSTKKGKSTTSSSSSSSSPKIYNRKRRCMLSNDNEKGQNDEVEIADWAGGKEHNCVLMQNLTTNIENRKTNTIKGDSAIYELTGVCNLVVMLHSEQTCSQLKKLFVYDLMRSMYARIRLLVDDLDSRKDIIGDAQLEDPYCNDASTTEEVYQTPNRIHIRFDRIKVNDNEKEKSISKKWLFLISDYVFPDETDADICERVHDLYDVEIDDAERQLLYVEDLPPEIKLGGNESSEDSDSNGGLRRRGGDKGGTTGDQLSKDQLVKSSKKTNEYKYYLGGLCGALVTIAGIYLHSITDPITFNSTN